MKRFSMLAAAAATASLMGFGTAYAAPAIVITQAPPPPQVEVIPQPRAGNVWVDGHWAWRNGEYKWVQGHWQTARRNMQWEQAHWAQAPDGSWQFIEGRWVNERGRGVARGNPHRDNDNDGVPNKFDRRPNDPGRS